MSASRKLQLVVGGLVVVGVGIGLLTFLYWRRTRPPAVNTALDALADLEASVMAAPSMAPLGSAAAAPPVVGLDAPTVPVPVSPGSTAAPPLPSSPVGAGSGVRILGPVAAAGVGAAVASGVGQSNADPKPGSESAGDSDSATAAATTGSASGLEEPEMLTIVTLEDLENQAAQGAASEVPPGPTEPDYGAPHD